MGEPDPADLNRALALARLHLAQEPQSARALGNVGSLLAALGRPGESLPFLQRAVSIDAHNPEMLNNFGAMLRATGRVAEAIPHFARALELAPAYADAHYNIAGAFTSTGAYARAIPHYQTLLNLRPASAEARSALAKALWKADRLDEALIAYREVITDHPGYHPALAEYGNMLTETGRFDEAVAAYTQAIALAPSVGSYYRFLADTRPAELTTAHLATLDELLRRDSLSDDDRIDANFALGKVYAAREQHEQSFRHFTAANAHRRRFISYDERATLEPFERIAQTFTRAFLDERRGCGDPSPVPIFIFGMPRSGTTLIEQILASHSDVFGAGELSAFEDITNATLAKSGPLTPQTMLEATCESLRDIGRQYVAELQKRAPTAARITDKMPANFRYAGLVRTVLPGARMIHAVRNPIDTCISCFSQNFAGEQPWAYDLAELGRYYRGYARLMAHWRMILPPGAVLEVRYEDVVDDLEAQARRIIAFCGLAWDDACLRFYETQRPVRTASAAQVRRPIYRTSMDRASLYADLLAPLIEALEPEEF